jgi:hypothetical protein
MKTFHERYCSRRPMVKGNIPMTGIRLLVAFLALGTITWAEAQDVLTYHNDNARTGQNLNETLLNPGNVTVNKFGKLFILSTDGKVDAEPLYAANLNVGSRTRNVVFIASEHASIYAYDADTGALLWQSSMLKSGETPSDDRGCNQVSPEIGVTATPVIDRASGPHGTIYAVAMSKDSAGSYHQRLHALDITTGAEEFGGPVEIQATYPGAGAEGNGALLTFDPKQHKERAALLLVNNTVYTAWSSHCDNDPYTGWIIGYDESTLARTRVLNITPNGNEGSIWQSGAGPAADATGNIYFLAANGTADTTLNAQGFPNSGNYGNAFMKLSSNGALAVADYFNMFNTVSENNADQDLGSGGALLLPDLTDSSNVTWRLAVGAGKDRIIYLVNRDNMGKFSTTNRIYQQFATPLGGGEFGMPAYFNNAIYYGSAGDGLKMFPFVNAKLTSPSSRTSITFAFPGTTPSISANGAANGIVWATENSDPAVLHAYDATNLGRELYNSNQAANGRDHFGTGNKFITPMIANGKVYVGTTTGVGVFGLIGAAASAQIAPMSLTFGGQLVGTVSSSQPVTLTNLTSTALTIGAITASGDFGKTDNCGSSLAGNASCTINVTFTPTTSGPRNGVLTVNNGASNSPQTASLMGTGTTSAPTVTLQPTSLSFGGQVVNTTSPAKSVTLTNTGTVSLAIYNIATAGNFAVSTGSNACGSSLAPGSNCLIYVTFTPTASDPQSGILFITDNAGNSPQSLQLSGTGLAQAIFSYLPQIADGRQAGGIAWVTSIGITNPASSGTASGTITFTQDNGAPFNVSFTDQQGRVVGSGNRIPFQLAAGQTNFFSSTAAGPLTVGFATVASNLAVVASAIFVETSNTTQTNIAQAGVAAGTPLARQAIFAIETKKADTGVAIVNPGPTTANITLQLLDTNGGVAFPPVTIALPANSHTARFVSQLFPSAAASSFYGTLQIISSTPVVTTALLFQSDGTFTALPVITLSSLLTPAIEPSGERGRVSLIGEVRLHEC